MAGCVYVEPGAGPVVDPPAATAEPQVRVAIVQGGETLRIGGGGGLLVANREGWPVLEIAAGTEAVVQVQRQQVMLRLGGSVSGPLDALDLLPRDPASWVRIAGRDYRGRVTISRDERGLLAVNRLGMEDYLAGVVNTEMGQRLPEEQAALEAQAIASRTYALRALGRSRTTPWDLVATIADQAYLGVERESLAGRAAVASTRGRVLTWAGEPIEAFFSSTCAGRTAAGDEVFINGRLPYLVSVSDRSPTGSSWCAISPRYRWREEWTGERLRAVLQQTLPPLGATAARTRARELHDLSITGHTGSGRVASLRIELGGSVVPVQGSPAVRQALRPDGSQLLRSAQFSLEVTRSGGRVARVVAEGQGAGHAVGLCQWGAVGRARAGQTAVMILAAYYPGTRLERRW